MPNSLLNVALVGKNVELGENQKINFKIKSKQFEDNYEDCSGFQCGSLDVEMELYIDAATWSSSACGHLFSCQNATIFSGIS